MKLYRTKKACKLKCKSDRGNTFYRSCPLNALGLRGKYEWLDVYIGLGCYPSANDNHITALTSSFFDFTAASHTIQNSNDQMDTKHNCVAYLFELCYDLLLSAVSNVSVNPGFEKFTLQC